MIFKISNAHLQELLLGENEVFPKYLTQILNLANQNAGATRPRVVGQMPELIEKFEGDSMEAWKAFYREIHPDSVEVAAQKIERMVANLQESIEKTDRTMIERWVRDLVITKSFVGLRFQTVILAEVARKLGKSARPATTSEEARGIDGWIGERAISIKPLSYKTQALVRENIAANLVFYEKTKDGLRIETDWSE